jgi:hypothetical protein
MGTRLLQSSGTRRGREEEIVGVIDIRLVGEYEGMSYVAIEQVSFSLRRLLFILSDPSMVLHIFSLS